MTGIVNSWHDNSFVVYTLIKEYNDGESSHAFFQKCRLTSHSYENLSSLSAGKVKGSIFACFYIFYRKWQQLHIILESSWNVNKNYSEAASMVLFSVAMRYAFGDFVSSLVTIEDASHVSQSELCKVLWVVFLIHGNFYTGRKKWHSVRITAHCVIKYRRNS